MPPPVVAELPDSVESVTVAVAPISFESPPPSRAPLPVIATPVSVKFPEVVDAAAGAGLPDQSAVRHAPVIVTPGDRGGGARRRSGRPARRCCRRSRRRFAPGPDDRNRRRGVREHQSAVRQGDDRLRRREDDGVGGGRGDVGRVRRSRFDIGPADRGTERADASSHRPEDETW